MSFFKNLLSDRRTSADLSDAILQAEADVRAATEQLESLRPERRALLLEGTDAEIRAAEQRIADASLTIDRGRAAIEELTRLRDLAAESERMDALQARKSEGELAAQRYVELSEIYANTLAPQMMKLLAEAADAHRTWHSAAREVGGEIGRIEPPSEILRMRGTSVHFQYFHMLVRLPAPNGFDQAYWWDGKVKQ